MNETSSANLALKATAATNTGLVRSLNEDAILAKFPVFIVADGMGGHSAGDAASQLVVDTFRPLVGRTDVTADEVRQTTREAQIRVSELADSWPTGAGSTVTGLVAVKEEGQPASWLIFNLGDSRTYRQTNVGVEQLTVDHSLVQELLSKGTISAEEADTHPQRNVITKALGDGNSAADFWITAMEPGQTFLVASDGLSGMVDDQQISQILSKDDSLEDRTRSLIEAALLHGGRDNVSVILLETGGDPAARQPTVVRGAFQTDLDDATRPRNRNGNTADE